MSKRKKRSGCLMVLLVLAAVIAAIYALDKWGLRPPGSGAAADSAAVIPGLSAAEVYEDFLSRGFTVMRGGQDGQKWNLMKKDGNITYTLEVFGRSSSQITKVQGSVVANPTADVSNQAAAFFSDVASRPYPGVEPSVARKWIASNIGTKTTSLLGGVQYVLNGESQSSKTLTIQAKP